MSLNTKILDILVWRGDCSGGKFEGFQVPHQESQTILDVVVWIQQNIDPSLAYRYACRVGMDGSCAMMVNGQPRWTCRTPFPRLESILTHRFFCSHLPQDCAPLPSGPALASLCVSVRICRSFF